ncbi:MAG TPA: hypothetical protein VHL52_11830, partial [Acidimicrobiia bacterium]|nr:hypothetical protein [Acidimicrobiia bacterium]
AIPTTSGLRIFIILLPRRLAYGGDAYWHNRHLFFGIERFIGVLDPRRAKDACQSINPYLGERGEPRQSIQMSADIRVR